MCKIQLINSIQNGNMGSVKYWLSNKHPDFIRPRKKHPTEVFNSLPFDALNVRIVTEKQVPDDPEEHEFIIPKENTINDSGHS